MSSLCNDVHVVECTAASRYVAHTVLLWQQHQWGSDFAKKNLYNNVIYLVVYKPLDPH
jgi:hypothetical protein